MGDGFSDEEARPSPFGRRRRLHHLDFEVGSLELTQGTVSQQSHKSARNLGKKAHPRTNGDLWQRRRYFGTSQFEIESQDPVESCEGKQEEAEDEDPAPAIVSLHSSQGSADDNIDLITIPRTDSPVPRETEESGATAEGLTESEVHGRADNHLPPKRFMNPTLEDSDGLTLRPDSLSWLRGVTLIHQTPSLRDTARAHL